MRRMNGRERTALLFGMAVLFLALITIAGQLFAGAASFFWKNPSP